jgi:tripartite-type tricarboxylate transporter receptor subunit TctC
MPANAVAIQGFRRDDQNPPPRPAGRRHRCCPASAQAAFPDRVVTLVNGFAAGGSSDIAARIASPRISQALGQTVVVENRPGAGGALALAWIRRQSPDGHTVIIADPSSLVIAPMVQPDTVTYRPTEDFTPLTIWGTSPMVLVVAPDHPAQDVAGLVTWIRAQGGRAAYASSGIGSTPQLAAELFLQKRRWRSGGDACPVSQRRPDAGSRAEERVRLRLLRAVSAAGHLRGGTLRALADEWPGPRRLLPCRAHHDGIRLPGFRHAHLVHAAGTAGHDRRRCRPPGPTPWPPR